MTAAVTPTRPDAGPSPTAPVVKPTTPAAPREAPSAADAAKPTEPTAGPGAESPADAPVAACEYDCPRCCALITTEQLKELFPDATDAKIDATKAAFNEAFAKFSVNKCLRKAHFFAQVMQEVGPTIQAQNEGLNYAPRKFRKPGAKEDTKGLIERFSYFRKHPDEADLYGRTKDHPADQQAIANRAYANRSDLGNGDIASGDGWNFRGKGFIQLTGKYNYEHSQEEVDKKYPGSGVDIIKEPECILTTRGGMISSMGYWSWKGLNAKADRGSDDKHVDAITRVVNEDTDTYRNRSKNFKLTKKAFRVSECTNK